MRTLPRQRVYALRSALLEPGTAPYLGGLRLAQARDCKQFLTGDVLEVADARI